MVIQPVDEKALLATGQYVRCKCHNLVSISLFQCSLCYSINLATTVKNCPTCGKLLKEPEPEPVIPPTPPTPPA